MSTPGTLREPSAAERAYDYVKGEILARRFAAHDLLSEGQLADAVGVSRTPVREALLRLQGEGLVRLLPKRGALVLPVTVDEAADVMETRRLVESFAARKVLTSRPQAALVPVLDGYLQDARREALAGQREAAIAMTEVMRIQLV